MAIYRKLKIAKIILIDKFVQNTSKSSIVSKHCFFGSAVTWLKIIQTLQSAPTVDININDFHHMGMSQMCTEAGDYFWASKPHSGKLWDVSQRKKLFKLVI